MIYVFYYIGADNKVYEINDNINLINIGAYMNKDIIKEIKIKFKNGVENIFKGSNWSEFKKEEFLNRN